MTCDQFKEAVLPVTLDTLTVGLAASICKHKAKCTDCRQWLHNLTKESSLSQAEKEEVYRDAIIMSMKIAMDPESFLFQKDN